MEIQQDFSHFRRVCCPLFTTDWPTFVIQQISLNFVQKRCTNYAKEAPTNA
jgi:hypothetical protein